MTPKILVKDYMRSLTVWFSPNSSVEEVVKTLLKHKLHGAPVLDDQHCLVGFISEQDCMKQMLNDTYYCEEHDVAADIMHKQPLSVDANEDILDLAQAMTQQRPKNYPVMEDGKVVGLITRADVLKALSMNRVTACSHA